MKLTKNEVFSLSPESFCSVGVLCNAIFERFSCGVSPETAARIIRDYNAQK